MCNGTDNTMKTVNIHSFQKGGKQNFDRYEVQRLFGIQNRGLWRKWVIACGFNPDSAYKYTWSDLVMFTALKLFLNAKRGRNGHTLIEFHDLRENNQLSDELLKTAKQLTEELKHDYQNNRLAS